MKDDEVLGENHYFSLFDMVFYERNIVKYCFFNIWSDAVRQNPFRCFDLSEFFMVCVRLSCFFFVCALSWYKWGWLFAMTAHVVKTSSKTTEKRNFSFTWQLVAVLDTATEFEQWFPRFIWQFLQIGRFRFNGKHLNR